MTVPAETGTATTRRRRAPRGSGEQLRAEIIAAAKALAAATDRIDDVSIRAVADAVGVTPPSIYLHFADKDELIQAVIVDVFTQLDQAMFEQGADAKSPLERLRAHGIAYVQFARAHPEHYRIAMMDPCPRPDIDEVFASSAFTHFRETVAECMAAGIFETSDPLPVTLELWAAAHGIASLMIAKPFLPWGDHEEVVDRVLCAAALGRAAGDIVGPPTTSRRVINWLAQIRQR